MIYKSNKPYPVIKVEKKNPAYVSILLNDYAGLLSEETAIHLYLYQSFMIEEELTEYKEMMRHIAEVEMIHLRLLGEIIEKLGGDPVYGVIGDDKMLRFWNSGNVEYCKDLKSMLEINIQSEQEAIKQYQNDLTIIEDIYIKEIIERILLDEYIHLSNFEKLYQTYYKNQSC